MVCQVVVIPILLIGFLILLANTMYYLYTHKLALLLAVFSLSNTGCMNISASSCLDKTLDSDNIGKTVQVDRLI